MDGNLRRPFRSSRHHRWIGALSHLTVGDFLFQCPTWVKGLLLKVNFEGGVGLGVTLCGGAH